MLLWCACILVLLKPILGDFEVQLDLLSFATPNGQDYSGECCDYALAASCNCGFFCSFRSYHCDLRFEVCIDRGTSAGANNVATCDTGWKTTVTIKNNVDQIEAASGQNLGNGWVNPQSFTIDGSFLHTDTFVLKFRAFDSDTAGDDLVDEWIEEINQQYLELDRSYRLDKHNARPKADRTLSKLRYRLRCHGVFEGTDCTRLPPQTCQAHLDAGSYDDGIYPLAVDGGSRTINAYCHMDRQRRQGWTVIQVRSSAVPDFNRNYGEYQAGFGSIATGGGWMGLANIHSVTAVTPQRLRVELSDCQGVNKFQEYINFAVADASDAYRMSVASVVAGGTAGDSLLMEGSQLSQNGQQFTTIDQDNDNWWFSNCAKTFKGGWWYNSCTGANPNGDYKENCDGVGGILWGSFHGGFNGFFSAKSVRLMLRPNQIPPQPPLTGTFAQYNTTEAKAEAESFVFGET